mgnify:CR=1 FL=1
MLREELHVEIAVFLRPAFMCLDGERPDKPQTPLGIREDPHHPRPALHLLIQFTKTAGAGALIDFRR